MTTFVRWYLEAGWAVPARDGYRRGTDTGAGRMPARGGTAVAAQVCCLASGCGPARREHPPRVVLGRAERYGQRDGT